MWLIWCKIYKQIHKKVARLFLYKLLLLLIQFMISLFEIYGQTLNKKVWLVLHSVSFLVSTDFINVFCFIYCYRVAASRLLNLKARQCICKSCLSCVIAALFLICLSILCNIYTHSLCVSLSECLCVFICLAYTLHIPSKCKRLSAADSRW